MKKIFASIIVMILICSPRPVKAQFSYSQADVDRLAAAMWAPVFKDLANDNLYKKDFAKLYKLCYNEIYGSNKQHPTPIAYYYMGACLELGMGGCETSQYKAKAHYEKGASLGNADCKKRLQDIKSKGYWGATNDNRIAFAKMHGRPMTAAGGVSPGGSGRTTPGRNSGTSTCKGCGGTGNCSYCGGAGENWIDAGTYVAGDRYVKRTCPVCHGSKRCGVCHGKGSL